MKKALSVPGEGTGMKAVVLAGGYATRLWPITKHRPKMFLPIGDTAVIDRIFEGLEDDDRVDEVFVSTNERFADEFRDHLDDSEFEKPTVSVEETREEDEKFGVVSALAQLFDREGVEEDTLVIAGDNVISFDLGEFLDFFDNREGSAIAAYDVGDYERAKSYGLVDLEGDEVVDFQEKPEDPKSTLVSIACYAFPAAVVPLLDEYLGGGNNPDEPGWFVQWLQIERPVHAYTFEEAWFDIGTAESYLDAVAWELDGENLVASSADLRDTTLGENVHVMPDAEIRDSHLDRSIVFPEAVVEGCGVRNSIIDEGTSVRGMDFSGALIGAHTTIDETGNGDAD
jgi:glucose-1-phosphate thymidylyltransferase